MAKQKVNTLGQLLMISFSLSHCNLFLLRSLTALNIYHWKNLCPHPLTFDVRDKVLKVRHDMTCIQHSSDLCQGFADFSPLI